MKNKEDRENKENQDQESRKNRGEHCEDKPMGPHDRIAQERDQRDKDRNKDKFCDQENEECSEADDEGQE